MPTSGYFSAQGAKDCRVRTRFSDSRQGPKSVTPRGFAISSAGGRTQRFAGNRVNLDLFFWVRLLGHFDERPGASGCVSVRTRRHIGAACVCRRVP